MSSRKNALRSQVESKVRDYVDEVERQTQLDQAALDKKQNSRIKQLEEKITELTTELNEVRGKLEHMAGTNNDKYVLTKAKLIRLMKDMGYI